MDNTKSFAKVILAAMGIYFLISTIPSIYYFVSMFLGRDSIYKNIWGFIIPLIINTAFILFIWYFFFYLRDWSAEKIVSKITPDQPSEKIPWFPAALRLVCIAVGLYFLLRSIFIFTQEIQTFFYYAVSSEKTIKTFFTGPRHINFIQLPLYLITGIYLICGAPYFVRWQVRRTLQQCKEFESIDDCNVEVEN